MISLSKYRQANILQILFLVLCLYGFEMVSFYPTFIKTELKVTVIFRVIFVAICIVTIIFNRVYFTKNFYPIIIFWVLYMLRVIYESGVRPETLQISQQELWSFSVLLCIVPMFAAASLYNSRTLLLAKRFTFIMLIIINILGIINNKNFLSPENVDPLARADGNVILNTISFAKTSASLIAMSFLYFINPRDKYKPLYIGTIILAVVNIFIAGSRGPLLQLAIFIFIYLYTQRKKIKRKYIFFMVSAIIFVLFYFDNYSFIFNLLFERLSTTGFDSNESDMIRAGLLSSGWNQFLENPFFGDGIQTDVGKTYPHNLIVESLMSIGFIGGILMVIICIKALIVSTKLLNNDETDWISAIVIMNLVASFSSGSIISYVILWPMIILLFNYYELQNNKSNNKQSLEI